MSLFSIGKNKTNQGGGNDPSHFLHDEKQTAGVILNGIDDAVMLIDSQNTIQIFNPAAAKLTGWLQEEADASRWRTPGRRRIDASAPAPPGFSA